MNSWAFVNMGKLIKYNDCSSGLELSDNTNDSDALNDLLHEYDECQAYVTSIMTSFAEIDSSIMDFVTSGLDMADSLFSIAEGELEKRHPNELVATANALVAAGAFVGTMVVGGIKKVKANNERRRKLDEALIVKQRISHEKYGLISERLVNMRDGLFSKIEKLYEKESSKSVNVDDEMLLNRIQLFKQSFLLYIKSRFLEGSLEFVLAEMDAWKLGKDDSDFKKMSISDYVENELSRWPEKVGECNNWDRFIACQLETDELTIPIQTAFLFSEPALVSRYVGVQLNDYGNCNSGHIHLSPGKNYYGGRSSKALLENNPYVKECLSIAETYYSDPIPKKKFSWVDILIMLIVPAVMCYCGIQLCLMYHSWFWRVLFSLLIALTFFLIFGDFQYFDEKKVKYKTVGLGLYQRLIESLLPYVSINQQLDKKQDFRKNQSIEQERILRDKYRII